MQSWAWLAAYVVGFGLLQVALYRRFHRRTATPEHTGAVEHTGGSSRPPSDAAETTECEHCGTGNENHRMVRYCRSCAEPFR